MDEERKDRWEEGIKWEKGRKDERIE